MIRRQAALVSGMPGAGRAVSFCADALAEQERARCTEARQFVARPTAAALPLIMQQQGEVPV